MWLYCKFFKMVNLVKTFLKMLFVFWHRNAWLVKISWKYCINRKWFGSLNLLCGASPILLCPAHCPRSAILDICEWFFIRIHTDFVFVFVFMNGSFSILIQTLDLYLCMVLHQNSYKRKEGINDYQWDLEMYHIW